MIEINNKHIVLMLLIIIIGVFIYNYDVYVIPKNEPLCKPVFVTKRELDAETRAELNKTESEALKETFNNLADMEYFETFNNVSTLTTIICKYCFSDRLCFCMTHNYEFQNNCQFIIHVCGFIMKTWYFGGLF